jgi:diphthine-ammonia ligase
VVKENSDVLALSRTYGRDSLETIESSGDVAYLRITAHTEETSLSSESWPSSPRPLLDNEFREIYSKTKDTPPFQPSAAEALVYALPVPPRLVRIGPEVYATDTISTPTPSSIEADTRYCLDTLISTPFQVFNVALLHAKGLSIAHVISTTLLLNDMSDFTTINPVYATYFTTPLPPSRVTISTTLPRHQRIYLSAIVSTSPRSGLHVQSRSYWAPANIGPYSQSISVRDTNM